MTSPKKGETSPRSSIWRGFLKKVVHRIRSNKMSTPQQPLPPPPPPPPTVPAPAPAPVTTPNPTLSTLNLDNIQGDILSGLPKKTETLYFFEITDVAKFRKDLSKFIPLIKTTAQVIADRKAIDDFKRTHGNGHCQPQLLPIVGVNIAFSHFGFQQLKIDDAKLADSAFLSGQRVDAGTNLLDKGTGSGANFVPDWEEPFKQEIHGVILLAGDSHASVNKKLAEIEHVFGVGGTDASLKHTTSVQGDARPGAQSGHEHFGFLDGVSNPAVIEFDKDIAPGPLPINAGHILLGETGDVLARDPWMVDGSFLVFRYLFQKVPEFDDFLDRNALQGPGLTKQQGADLLGARLVGRWKSGAPVDITPFEDDTKLGPDPTKNNNFHFKAEATFQKMCPFAAHVRKTLPRDDLERLPGFSIAKNRIMRRGIQFGPEVTEAEKAAKQTSHGRGLVFVCYQASIVNGFQFIQKSWVNNTNFPFGTPQVPGVDPILGQGPGRALGITGFNPNDPTAVLKLDNEWVVPRGGEYFFSPSIKGLTDTIATH